MKQKKTSKNCRIIIGFAGRKRSGKTMLSKLVRDFYQNSKTITLANYLKTLCCDLMNMSLDELNEKKDNGYEFDVVPDERWFNIIAKTTGIDETKIKDSLNNVHIKNIRQLLQVVGTDVIRKYDTDWHVKQFLKEVEETPIDTVIVIDDVRFTNELKAIKDMGGVVFFVMRPRFLNVSNHISETSLQWKDFNYENIIINGNHGENLIKDVFRFFLKDSILYHGIVKNVVSDFVQSETFGDGYDKNSDFFKDLITNLKIEHTLKGSELYYCTTNREYAEKFLIETKCVQPTSLGDFSNKNDYHLKIENPLTIENLKVYL